jgi:hypothetical protein
MKIHSSVLQMISEHTNLTHDSASDSVLHYDDASIRVYASKMTEKEYNKMCKDINKFIKKGKGYEIYTWNDASSYKYWSRLENESNYIQISVSITDANKLDIDQLKTDVIQTYIKFHNKYDNSEF